jgi:glycosyltransferase involved in cell wall biosynthesis
MKRKNEKLRILVVSVFYPPYVSGVATVAGKLAREMARRGHEVGVMCPSRDKEPKTVVVDGVTEFRLKSSVDSFLLDHQLPTIQPARILKIINEFEPDMIHFHDPSKTAWTALGIARTKKIPLLYTNHLIPEYVNSYLRRLIKMPIKRTPIKAVEKVVGKYISLFCNRCDYLTTPTHFVKKYLVDSGVKTEVEVISNGIDLSKFKFAKKKTNKIPKLLYFGRLGKDKSLDVLLRGANKIEVPFRLIIAGDGEDKEKLLRIYKELHLEKKVTFTGFVEEGKVEQLFSNSDIFVIASTVECQSIVTMQAIAYGLPVIAANAAALPELVRDNVNGFVFKPGDYNDFAAKATELLTNKRLRNKFAKAGQKIVKEHAVKKTFDKYENVYLSLAKN